MSGPICLCILGFLVPHHLCYQYSTQTQENKVTFYSQAKNDKYIIYKVVSSVLGLALATKTTCIEYLQNSIGGDGDNFMLISQKRNAHTQYKAHILKSFAQLPVEKLE